MSIYLPGESVTGLSVMNYLNPGKKIILSTLLMVSPLHSVASYDAPALVTSTDF
jgi:hypothetical protein